MIAALRSFLAIREIRRRLLGTIVLFALYRFAATIPVPGSDPAAVRQFFGANQFLGLINLLSGGVLENISIVSIGLTPYITLSMIMNMLMKVIPRLEEMVKEGGEMGRIKLEQYTRLLTVPMTIIQAFGLYFLFGSQNLLPKLDVFPLIVLILTLVAGSMLLLWLADQFVEYGIGNGTSMIIFGGIVVSYPRVIGQALSTSSRETLLPLIGVALGALAAVYIVVRVHESARRIPIAFARRMQGSSLSNAASFLPVKLGLAGVMPIYTALSLSVVFGFAATALRSSQDPTLFSLATFITRYLQPPAPVFLVLYGIIVVFLTYVWTEQMFNVSDVSDDLRRRGAFIPGIRPGKPTIQYLQSIMTRITFIGGVFLAFIGLMPYVMQSVTDVQAAAIGGTGLLIVVNVVLETLKQVEAMALVRDYEGFL